MQDIIHHLERDPHQQFLKWYDYAMDKGYGEANAFSLSTVGKDGRPHSRVLLWKGMNQGRFCFYTNYDSNKAIQMQQNPFVAMNFYWWLPIGYQVRIEGKAEKLSRQDSEKYFLSRPRESRLSAWASAQSQPLANRQALEEDIQSAQDRFAGKEVPCPENWGGYGVTADYFEFMILDKYRAHDRFVYCKQGSLWSVQRLAP
tara:strand:+ start:22897 stop:23499 length:603 start_codon:yes stop_codon:yes gene_type:complete